MRYGAHGFDWIESQLLWLIGQASQGFFGRAEDGTAVDASALCGIDHPKFNGQAIQPRQACALLLVGLETKLAIMALNCAGLPESIVRNRAVRRRPWRI
jgi:hypothetical protein